MQVIVRLQDDAPVPPLDAASARSWASAPWPQAEPVRSALDETDSPAMPIVSVTLGDRRVSGRMRADPPIWSVVPVRLVTVLTAPNCHSARRAVMVLDEATLVAVMPAMLARPRSLLAS